jgi:hypothetical protein
VGPAEAASARGKRVLCLLLAAVHLAAAGFGTCAVLVGLAG